MPKQLSIPGVQRGWSANQTDHGVLPTSFKQIDEQLLLRPDGQPYGGLPWGGAYELWGPQESGKSLLCYHIAVQAQAAGHTVCWWTRRTASPSVPVPPTCKTLALT